MHRDSMNAQMQAKNLVYSSKTMEKKIRNIEKIQSNTFQSQKYTHTTNAIENVSVVLKSFIACFRLYWVYRLEKREKKKKLNSFLSASIKSFLFIRWFYL